MHLIHYFTNILARLECCVSLGLGRKGLFVGCAKGKDKGQGQRAKGKGQRAQKNWALLSLVTEGDGISLGELSRSRGRVCACIHVYVCCGNRCHVGDGCESGNCSSGVTTIPLGKMKR